MDKCIPIIKSFSESENNPFLSSSGFDEQEKREKPWFPDSKIACSTYTPKSSSPASKLKARLGNQLRN
jgi:hypothetical protein